MTTHALLEILGYLASVLVTVSLMMRSIVRLRWINLAGAILFTVYGVMIGAYPVAALNLAVVGINIYHLWRMRRRVHEAFALAHMPPDSQYVRQFLAFHQKDIKRTQPAGSVPPDATVIFVLRDTVPAGVLAITPPDEQGTGTVTLDFATPAYRDLKVGTYIYHGSDHQLEKLGYRRLVTAPGSPDHEGYLERMGFRREPQGFVMDLEGSPTPI